MQVNHQFMTRLLYLISVIYDLSWIETSLLTQYHVVSHALHFIGDLCQSIFFVFSLPPVRNLRANGTLQPRPIVANNACLSNCLTDEERLKKGAGGRRLKANVRPHLLLMQYT
jgi:hypothetical protein